MLRMKPLFIILFSCFSSSPSKSSNQFFFSCSCTDEASLRFCEPGANLIPFVSFKPQTLVQCRATQFQGFEKFDLRIFSCVEQGSLTVEVKLNQFDFKLQNANRRNYDYLGLVLFILEKHRGFLGYWKLNGNQFCEDRGVWLRKSRGSRFALQELAMGAATMQLQV